MLSPEQIAAGARDLRLDVDSRANLSREMDSVLMVVESDSELSQWMLPIIDVKRETILWESLEYGAAPGGVQAAVSWLYGLWTGTMPPKHWRDPFEALFDLDRATKRTVFCALAYRHGER